MIPPALCHSAGWPFSPLFIGEYSATIKQHLVFSYARIFQSPLHRGILCNLIVVVKKQTGESFSPLFIGEYSATLMTSFHSSVS